MPWITLSATKSNNAYGGQASVTEQQYNLCGLFHKYVHKPTGHVELSDILVYHERGWTFSGGDHVTLKIDKYPYQSNRLESEEVYFNSYENKTPLLLVLNFVRSKSKYYKRSQFHNDITQNITKSITELSDYNNEKSILSDLINENNNLNDFLTYDINLKDDTSGTSGKSYNVGKITVKKLTTSSLKKHHFTHMLDQLTQKSYSIHSHDPESRYTTCKSCFLYNNNVPMKKNKSVITDIQNKKYNVTVYWNDKVIYPLLLEFNQGGSGRISNNKYYYHKRGDDNSLHWEEITKGINISGVGFDLHNTIFYQLEDNKNNKLIQILKKVLSDFQKCLYIMVDKKESYSKSNVTSSFTESTKRWLINKTITPMDKTFEIAKCLSDNGFKLYEHDFISSVNDLEQNEEIHIKFILPYSNKNIYLELKLFRDNSNEDYLIYSKGSGDNKLYLYFYGEDPRPLLLYYNGKGYKATDKNSYFYKWYKDDKIDNFKCKRDGKNLELTEKLSEVIGFLNEVHLEIRPDPITILEPDQGGKINEKKLYKAQDWHGKQINNKVTYWNLKCYRTYIHEVNTTGYRLGIIMYESKGPNDIGLNYTLSKQLEKVYVYYNIYDNNHEYPLLVTLKFKTGNNEYYKLKNTSKPFKWEKINDTVNPGDIENKTLEIWKELNIDYKKDSPLFKTNKCNEGSPNLAVYIGVPVGGLTGAASLGGGGYIVYVKFIATSATV